MADQTSKQGLWTTAVVAGLITLLVNFVGPWLIHFFNPNGAKAQVIEISAKAQRRLDPAFIAELSNAPDFKGYALQSFPVSTYVPQAGFDGGVTCHTWLQDGSIDDQCVPIVLRWAKEAGDYAAVDLAQLNDQTPAPADKANQINYHKQVSTYAAKLVTALSNLKTQSQSKDGDFMLNVVLLNSGDGDDVLYPDATLTCEPCGKESVRLNSTAHYVTLRAHSFQQVRYQPDAEYLTADMTSRLKEIIRDTAVVKVHVCSHLASNKEVCGDGELR